MDEELEDLRKKRIADMEQQAELQDERERQQKEFEKQKKMVLRTILTTDARERLGRIRVARPEMAEAIENQLISLYQQGQLKNKINDEQLRILLRKLIPPKREFKIKRR
jgi:programmed cell death protein 5